jgi:hypothetical protein
MANDRVARLALPDIVITQLVKSWQAKGEGAMTKWRFPSLSQTPDQTKRIEGLRADLGQLELVEGFGYNEVRIAGHPA